MVVQWLGLHALTAERLGLISGQGTRIPQAMWSSQKKRKIHPKSIFFYVKATISSCRGWLWKVE